MTFDINNQCLYNRGASLMKIISRADTAAVEGCSGPFLLYSHWPLGLKVWGGKFAETIEK